MKSTTQRIMKPEQMKALISEARSELIVGQGMAHELCDALEQSMALNKALLAERNRLMKETADLQTRLQRFPDSSH